jgi:hypothetical protein
MWQLQLHQPRLHQSNLREKNVNDIATLLIGFFAIAANSILLMYIFPFRFNPRVSIALVVFLVVSHFTVLLNLSPANLDMGGLRGLIYFPVFMILLKGSFFQKAFVYSLQAVLTVSSALLIREISRFLFAEEHIGYSISRLAMVVAAYFFYVAAVIKKRSVIYDKLFLYGNTREWILYSFAGMSAFFMIAISRLTKTDRLGSMFILVFILMSFSILIYAIVITHEKTKQKMEADFARSIVSSGRDHYQKMNEMNDKLRILRHDYKYHVSAAREMLRSGDSGGADNYLINVEHQLAAYEIKNIARTPFSTRSLQVMQNDVRN